MTASLDASTREVPAYDVHEFRPKSTEYCVCIPVMNENGRIRRQLEKMRPLMSLADVAVADGGSTDGSTDHELLKSFGVNSLMVKRGPGRLGAQMRMAFAWGMDRGYKGVILIDGNDKDGPEAISLFLEKLRAGFDHIQGSRFVPGGISENLPLSRWFGLKFIHAPLISLASRWRYTDTTNGFRGYSRRLLEDPRMAVFRKEFVGYEYHWYLAIRAARLGFRVCEVPVARRYPADGTVPTKISPVKGSLLMIRELVATCLGKYNPR